MKYASDIMTTDVITVSPDMEIVQAARILIEKNINGVPVVDDDGFLVGILCQSDLINQQRDIPVPSYFVFLDGIFQLPSSKRLEKSIKRISAATVGDAMTADPETVTSETSIKAIASIMVEKKYHTLPVVDGGKLVGIVGKKDILRTLTE